MITDRHEKKSKFKLNTNGALQKYCYMYVWIGHVKYINLLYDGLNMKLSVSVYYIVLMKLFLIMNSWWYQP